MKSDSNNVDFVFGRHAGLDFLRTQDASLINKIFLQNGVQASIADQVYQLAKKEKIIVQSVPKSKLDKLVDQQNHQGLVLAITPFEYTDLNDLLKKH